MIQPGFRKASAKRSSGDPRASLGIAGFIPGLVQGQGDSGQGLAVDAGSEALLGLFPVNVVHHLVQLLGGVLGIAAYRAFDSARLYARGRAIVYGVLTVMGLISATYFGWGPVDDREEVVRRV